MNLEKSSQRSVNIEISLDLKVCFSLLKCKINNLIAQFNRPIRSMKFLHCDDYALILSETEQFNFLSDDY